MTFLPGCNMFLLVTASISPDYWERREGKTSPGSGSAPGPLAGGLGRTVPERVVVCWLGLLLPSLPSGLPAESSQVRGPRIMPLEFQEG